MGEQVDVTDDVQRTPEPDEPAATQAGGETAPATQQPGAAASEAEAAVQDQGQGGTEPSGEQPATAGVAAEVGPATTEQAPAPASGQGEAEPAAAGDGAQADAQVQETGQRQAQGTEASGPATAAEGEPVQQPQPGGEPEAAEPQVAAVAAAEAEAATGAAGSGAAQRTPDEGDSEGEAMMADLVAARAEAESYLDDLRRLQAEFDNYRKRMLREQTNRIASASQALVEKLLPVLDNFELAVSAAEQSRDFDRMVKGVEMVYGQLKEVLDNEGLVPIEAEGKPFDPERHEAVVAVEQEGAEPGTVVDVIRKGYEFKGRVLRPAMVKVAK